MTLPTSRNRTYTADSPVRSNDLNDIQDAIIGGLHGPVPSMFSGSVFVPFTGEESYFTIGGDGFWEWVAPAAVARFLVGNLVVPVGSTITRAVWYYDRGGAGTLNFLLQKVNKLGSDSSLTNVAGAGTGWTTKDSDVYGAFSYTTVAGDAIVAVVDGDNAAHKFQGVELTWKRE